MNHNPDTRYCEFMLVERQGTRVVLDLAGEWDEHPFAGMAASDSNGGRGFIGVIPLNADESPQTIAQRVEQKGKKEPKKVDRFGKHVTRAACMCKDSDFQKFVYSQLKKMDDDTRNDFKKKSGIPPYLTEHGISHILANVIIGEEWAAFYLRWYCGIPSRAALAWIDEGSEGEKWNKGRELWGELKGSFSLWNGQT